MQCVLWRRRELHTFSRTHQMRWKWANDEGDCRLDVTEQEIVLTHEMEVRRGLMVRANWVNQNSIKIIEWNEMKRVFQQLYRCRKVDIQILPFPPHCSLCVVYAKHLYIQLRGKKSDFRQRITKNVIMNVLIEAKIYAMHKLHYFPRQPAKRKREVLRKWILNHCSCSVLRLLPWLGLVR